MYFEPKVTRMIKSLLVFFNKQAKSIPKQVNSNCEWFEWGNVG
ncbi:hypothetical protein HPHPP26_0405 [Helicobacter pylori Hp P-26]|nr:hypothetical protein HPHPP26_0405 [Helicobacter pylori Hp P-26]